MQSYTQKEGKIFFVHSAGDCGKIFVCNTIAAAVRSSDCDDQIALCVASSGIAALLLDGGHTAHPCSKLPIPCHEDSVCNIKKNLSFGMRLWIKHCRTFFGNYSTFGGSLFYLVVISSDFAHHS